jgi:hypothetical protein
MVDFSSAILEQGAVGNRRVHRGTWTNGATGAKNIDTGLRVVTSMKIQQQGSAVIADAATVNETLPCDGSAVTIVTTGNTQNGYWVAEGYL